MEQFGGPSLDDIVGTTQFGFVVTPSQSTVKMYEEVGKAQFQRGQREAIQTLTLLLTRILSGRTIGR